MFVNSEWCEGKKSKKKKMWKTRRIGIFITKNIGVFNYDYNNLINKVSKKITILLFHKEVLFNKILYFHTSPSLFSKQLGKKTHLQYHHIDMYDKLLKIFLYLILIYPL
jgi:hypothetical protein